MWGCKMIRTARSWIRMCGHNMVSEASAQRFVFRSRASPACASECEKMQFHIQREEEPETATLTVDCRVFDVCFSDLMSVRAEKARAKQVALCFWCAVPLRTHPPTYDRRSAPCCIHLQLHPPAVRLFSTHCETMARISENPLSCLYS